MPTSIRPGDELSGRYRLVDLLDESRGGRFFRGFDSVLARHVAIHVISCDDDRAPLLSAAARESARMHDRRILRVLDTDDQNGMCFVVNEWGSGRSLDIVLADEGPMSPRRAAWLSSEVAAALADAHEMGVAHGRLVPENVLIDLHGHVRLIGYAVDAALHGLPPGRRSADVTDLAGILYAALTGRWAGVSDSALPPAHLEGERVLRPRRVRAGIPRDLDQLCDAVLNGHLHPARGMADLSTAAGIAEVLRDFVGDPTGMAEAEATRARLAGTPPIGSPQLEPLQDPPVAVPVLPPDRTPEPDPEPDPEPAPDPVPAPDPAPEPAPEPEPGPEPTPESTPEPAVPLDPTDVPTQAGMPVFVDDTDQVAWIARTTEPPTPPPPLEEPEPKPLFAPEPSEGRPQRTPRAGTAAAEAPSRDGYWPWGEAINSSTGTGTGAVPPYDSSITDSGYLDEVPGRGFLRTAMVIAACVLALLAVVFAFGLGRGERSTDQDEPSPDPTSQEAEALQPVEGLSATDLDPQGDPPEENPDLVPLAVDGNAETAWRTMTYNENFGPAGLKTGLGLVVDLTEVRAPRQVSVTFVGEQPTGFSLFLSTSAPDSVRGLDRVAQDSGTGTVTVELDGQQRGRYLTVWLTSLPASADGGFRGEIAEIAVQE